MANYPRPAARISSNTITRPADTTAYASGDLVANNTTAGSVTPFTFSAVARAIGHRSRILRAGLLASQVLLANGTFRLHLFSALPTVTNGDNAALDVATNALGYLGWFEIALALNATGLGTWGWSSDLATAAAAKPNFVSQTSQALFGLLEARAAYVPASGQTFQTFLEVEQY